MRIIEEGEKGRWIGIHPQPLILLISFYLIYKDYDWLETNKYLLFKVLHYSGLAASLCSINIIRVITKV